MAVMTTMGQDTVVGNKGSCWVGERFVVVVLAVTRSIPHCPFCAGERQRMVQSEDPFRAFEDSGVGYVCVVGRGTWLFY